MRVVKASVLAGVLGSSLMGCLGSYPPSPVVVVVTPPLAVATSPETDPEQTTACDGRERVQNGGFELPVLTHGSWSVFQEIEGWRSVSGAGAEIQNNVAGSPKEGRQFLELDSNDSSAIVQQVPTEGGRRYELRFAFTGRGGTTPDDNVLEVLWNGRRVAELLPKGVNPDWRTYRFEVNGRQGSSRLELRDKGTSNGLGTYVDAVSVKAICDGDDGELVGVGSSGR